MSDPDDRPDAHELWRQAGGGTKDYSRERYHDLAREHGLIRDLAPGEKREPLPCGWPGPRRDVEQSPELLAAKAEVERLLAVGKLAMQLRAANPVWREGQCAFNALRRIDEECALAVLGSKADPFYDDSRLDAFWTFVADWTAPLIGTEENK